MKLAQQISLLFILASFALNLASAERSTYVVHMDKSFMPKAFASHQYWYKNTLESLKSTSTDSDPQKPLELLYTYDNVFHGFSAVLSKAELEAVKNLPGFVSAYTDKVGTLDTTHSSEFLSLNPQTGLWPASDYGKDVIIGVLDTGVWPESRSYRDHGMTDIPSKWKGTCDGGYDFNSSLCNKKLIGARYFNKGLLAENPDDRNKKYSARDTDGHGTHTSSIAAGNYVDDVSFFGYARGTARGVAPRARLAIYKASFREGRYASDVLAALDQAVADGVDVISISLGYNSIPFYEDPIAIASFAAMEKGVFVSTSAGNSGTSPRRLHNGIPWVLTVAAGSMDRSFGGSITLGNGVKLRGWSLFPAKAVVKDSTLVYNETIAPCNSTELLSGIHGGTIICDNTSYSFSSQISIISQSDATAAIFISSDYTYDESSFEYPGVIITPEQAAKVIDYASKDPNPTVTIKFQQTFLGTKPAPMVAEYTRFGPSPTYPGILKPDLMAPGTLVLAAWIPDDPVSRIDYKISLSNSDDFNLISGTSMACPHAAGIAALLKAAHPDWSPAAIRSAMVTTANPFDDTGNPIRELDGFTNPIASPQSMGAGQVNPNSALDPGLIYDATAQDYIQLLCSANYTRKQIRTITRTIYNCSKASSSDLNYPSFISLYASGTTSSAQKFERIVTNVGDGAATYKVNVTAPKGSVVTVNPKTLEFKKKYEKKRYSLTIRYKIDENNAVTFGSVIWVEDSGKHTVRSPILVTQMISSDDS